MADHASKPAKQESKSRVRQVIAPFSVPTHSYENNSVNISVLLSHPFWLYRCRRCRRTIQWSPGSIIFYSFAEDVLWCLLKTYCILWPHQTVYESLQLRFLQSANCYTWNFERFMKGCLWFQRLIHLQLIVFYYTNVPNILKNSPFLYVILKQSADFSGIVLILEWQ